MRLLLASALLLSAVAPGRPEAAAPYPPSGWRPEGRQFPPPGQYGPPPPAAPTTTEAAEPTTTELPTTAAPAAALQSGVYYLLQPDGRLQRVSYAHGPAPAAPAAPAASLLMERLSQPGYLARFHYQDLLPHGAPVYAYRQPGLVRIS